MTIKFEEWRKQLWSSFRQFL